MPGGAVSITSGNEEVVVVNDVGGIYRWNGYNWDYIGGMVATEAAISPEGVIYAISKDNTISSGDGAVYRLDPSRLVWEHVAGGYANRISVWFFDQVVVSTSSGAVYYTKWAGTQTSWQHKGDLGAIDVGWELSNLIYLRADGHPVALGAYDKQFEYTSLTATRLAGSGSKVLAMVNNVQDIYIAQVVF